MTSTLERPAAAAPEDRPAQPRPGLRVLSGVLAAGAAVGVGHLLAALTDPVTSPVLAVGSALIDAAPTPAKEYAVRTFGTADKPILVGSVGVVLLVFAAVVGLLAWRRPRTAAVAIGRGGVVVGRLRESGAAARRALGLPVPSSPAPALPPGVQLPGMTPFTTPAEDFYRVDISLVTPRIDASSWSLTIDGMVEQPVTLSYDDLLAMPMVERDITLTCVSNEVGGSYVSTGRWLGVPFSAIIERVGVQAGVDQVYSYSSDSGYTCSTPYQAVSDGRDAMVVVGLNGQPLADERGYPARMLVPGLFGFVSATKWLERIEFTTYDRRTAYWTERDWATDAPVLTQSRIDVPESLATLAKDKPVIAGVAWAQHRGIAKVEIRIDDGDWQEATLADDGGIDLWRQWSFRYDGPAGLHSAQVRATDLDGETQPEERTKVFPSGARGWHQIQFTAE